MSNDRRKLQVLTLAYTLSMGVVLYVMCDGSQKIEELKIQAAQRDDTLLKDAVPLSSQAIAFLDQYMDTCKKCQADTAKYLVYPPSLP